jgi:hypothetical protein
VRTCDTDRHRMHFMVHSQIPEATAPRHSITYCDTQARILRPRSARIACDSRSTHFDPLRLASAVERL